MADEREGDVARRRSSRVRSIARTSGSASRSSRPDRSRTCCSRSCCSRARTWPAFPDSARCSPSRCRERPRPPPAFARAISSSRSTASRCSSWQDLRWRLTKAQGRDTVALAIEPAGPHAGDPPVTRRLVDREDAAGRLGGQRARRARLARGPRASADRGAGRRQARRACAGLKAGDRIVAINGAPVRSPGDVAAITNANPGVPIVFRIERGGAHARTSR